MANTSCAGAAVEWLQPESDAGNVEYKLRLKDPNPVRFQQLVLSHLVPAVACWAAHA